MESWGVSLRVSSPVSTGCGTDITLCCGPRFAGVFLLAMAGTAILAFPLGPDLPGLGQDFFPTVDSGQILLHVRARTGLRIEETAALCDAIEGTIRQTIPASQLASVVDNIGLPYSGINLAYSTSAPIGPADADILVSLSERHGSTEKYVHDLRIKLADEFPGVTFSFLPADIISQNLNFGLPSPIDVQIVGYNLDDNRRFADALLEKIRYVPGAVDLRIQQAFDQPKLHVNVDRTKAGQVGFTERDIATNLL